MTTSERVPATAESTQGRPRVVIIGSGFGGLFAARALRRRDVDITLIGKTTHHLFQPLLYQVATGILSEGEIAPPTREILRGQHNARVVLGEVTHIDLAARTVTSEILGRVTTHPYDELVVAAGAGQSYFGNDHFAEFAPGMKSIDDALELRGRIFGAFELAELAHDQAEIDRLMTFVVVGAGPTGVEMAGQIAELAHRTLRKRLPQHRTRHRPRHPAGRRPRRAAAFGEKLGGRPRRQLTDRRRGAARRHGHRRRRERASRSGTDGRRAGSPAVTKIWAAGVQASPLGAQLAEQSGAEVDRAGRIARHAGPDPAGPPRGLRRRRHDRARQAARSRPGRIQGARYAAEAIRRRLAGKAAAGAVPLPRQGLDGDDLAVQAVADIGKLKFTGFIAWLMWLVVHLVLHRRLQEPGDHGAALDGQLPRPRRAERVTTQQQVYGRLALEELGPDFKAGKTGGTSTTLTDEDDTGRQSA